MEEPFEETYFNWLCAKVRPSRPFWKLLGQMHRTEFVPLLQMDENRAAYGQELRREFLIAADAPDNPEWRETLGCSIFELLIAVARDLSFQKDDGIVDCFWELVNNLGLITFDDDTDFEPQYVDAVLDVFISRTYHDNGVGGLFPIEIPERDQRDVEIWSQMMDYLADQEAHGLL